MSGPNGALDSLLQEAALSRRRLAQRLQLLSTQRGRPVHTTGTTVTRWIRDGDQPHPWTRQLLLEVLSTKLGRPLIMADLGMTGNLNGRDAIIDTSLVYNPSARQTVRVLTELASADLGSDAVHRRQFLTLAAFNVSALSAPCRDWLLNAITTAPTLEPRQVKTDQVSAIRETFAAFQRLDTTHGGGHARLALVQYLNSGVLPLLQTDQGDAVRADLFSAAAEHAYLAGWMSWDDALPGLAQRYFTQSLRLAQEATDPLLGAHVLTGMAHLTLSQGQPAEALQLLRSAEAATGTGPSAAAIRSRLFVLQGRALAMIGESASAARALHLAEQAHDKIQESVLPSYADFIDIPYLAGETASALAHVGQHRQAERAAASSLRNSRGGRRATFTYATLTCTYAATGDLEAAVAAMDHAAEAALAIHSHRALQAIGQACAALRPYEARPVVKAALVKVHRRLPELSAGQV